MKRWISRPVPADLKFFKGLGNAALIVAVMALGMAVVTYAVLTF